MSKLESVPLRMKLLYEARHRARHTIYLLFRVYNRYIAHRFPLSDVHTIAIISRLPSDAICIDIGANEGQFLYYMARNCKNGQIIAYEPLPHLFHYLKKRFRRNVEVRNTALLDNSNETTYFHFPKRNGLSGLNARSIANQQGLLQETWSLKPRCLDDDFRGDRLDFIKIDVEGAEMNVLLGARNTLLRLRPIIVFESGWGGLEFYGYRPEQLFSFFHQIGYGIHTPFLFLQNRKPFSKVEFVGFCEKGYDCQFVASPLKADER